MKVILAPIDFTDITDKVIKISSQLASALGAQLHLLHVAAPNPDFIGYETGPQTVRDGVAHYLKKEHGQLEMLENQLKKEGIAVQAHMVQGATADKILEEARRLNADLIIMGSHGHSTFHHILVGSVAEGVLRTSTCPVLIVPGRKPSSK